LLAVYSATSASPSPLKSSSFTVVKPGDHQWVCIVKPLPVLVAVRAVPLALE
jgi:hypothetical protein